MFQTSINFLYRCTPYSVEREGCRALSSALCVGLECGPSQRPLFNLAQLRRSSERKMAAVSCSRRARSLLRLFLWQCVFAAAALGVKPGANGNFHPPPPPAVVPVNRQLKLGAGSPVNVGGGGGVSRRAGGWKLAEEAACRDDANRLCPKHSWSNNLAVLECLQDRKEVRGHPGGFPPSGSVEL